MKGKWQRKTAIPSLDQIESERKRYRWQKAYFKALRGTISVLTYMAAVAALIATLVLPVLQVRGPVPLSWREQGKPLELHRLPWQIAV